MTYQEIDAADKALVDLLKRKSRPTPEEALRVVAWAAQKMARAEHLYLTTEDAEAHRDYRKALEDYEAAGIIYAQSCAKVFHP